MALISCPHCGNKISDKASQCPKCGYKIVSIEEKVLEKKEEENENKPLIIENNIPDIPKKDFKNTPKQKTSNKRKNVLWISLCILLLLGIGIYFGISYYQNQEFMAEKLAIIEKQHQDSIIAEQKELARLEKLRQNSIALEKEKFKSEIDEKFVTPGLIFTYSDSQDHIKHILKNLGYSVSTRTQQMEWYDNEIVDEIITTYELKSSNKEYPVWNKVIFSNYPDEGEICYIEFCDEDHLNDFIKKSIEIGFVKDTEYSGVEFDEWKTQVHNIYKFYHSPLRLRLGIIP